MHTYLVRKARIAAAALLIALPAAGLGGCDSGSTKNAAKYLVRIAKGEAPETVINDARGESAGIGALVRAHAGSAEAVSRYVKDADTRHAACVTLDWVKEQGGTGSVSEQDVFNFAVNQFSRPEQAKDFAANLVKLGSGDLSGVTSITCTLLG
jgi:hypothetical protein